MSSHRYATPLHLRLEHSPRLRAIYLLFVTICIVSILVTTLPITVKLLLLAALVTVGVIVWVRRVELGGEPAELVLRPNGSWLLHRTEGEETLQLHGQSTVSHAVTILVFSGEDGRRQFVLWRREWPENTYRRLQVYLQLYAGEAVG